MNKPFKPPSLRRPIAPPAPLPPDPNKPAGDNVGSAQAAARGARAPLKRPAASQAPAPESTSSAPAGAGTGATAATDAYFRVLWRKFTLKKNKTWDGDGTVALERGYLRLYSESGAELGRAPCPAALRPGARADPVGTELSIAGRDVVLEEKMSKADFLAETSRAGQAGVKVEDEDNDTRVKREPPSLRPPARRTTPQDKGSNPLKRTNAAVDDDSGSSSPRQYIPNPASSSKLLSKFRPPTRQAQDGARTTTTTTTGSGPASNPPKPGQPPPVPRHDPTKPGALVLKRPDKPPPGRELVDVVVDPLLAVHLREHQREGVKFLYECVMGLRDYDGHGCILADEMGLGKTLQTIALLWTLLKQNPVHKSAPVIQKAVVVCPVGLVDNWRKEFRKWLGDHRIGVFVLDDAGKFKPRDFLADSRVNSVMIVGYERFRTVAKELAEITPIPGLIRQVDVVVADEGHRLKTVQNKAALAIRSLSTPRRVILSGTPIQNDLSEFYAMADLANPGLLGKYNAFKKTFETPILRSREPGARRKEVELGESRATELAELTAMFVLRRTTAVLTKFLPPKTEYVFFCRPAPAQVEFYERSLRSPLFASAFGSTESALLLINILRKICNCPSLLVQSGPGPGPAGEGDGRDGAAAEAEWRIPGTSRLGRVLRQPLAGCSKMLVLDRLLELIRTTTDEKVVVVSNWTATLDVIGRHLAGRSYGFARLDGSVPAPKRQALVDRFNRAAAADCFALLLSARAGGVGLNLVGASRLVLFDIDWNPAVDAQAMGRIHRDGQARACHIYRLLTMGALDERVFQRQVTKLALAEAVVDRSGGGGGGATAGKESTPSFSPDELRKLFALDLSDNCRTHELIGCGCGGDGNRRAALEDGDDDDGDDGGEDEEDLPDVPTLMAASKVDMEKQERALEERRTGRDKMRFHTLRKYIHYRVGIEKEGGDGIGLAEDRPATPDELFDDHVTARLLGEDDPVPVRFVFAKKAAE